MKHILRMLCCVMVAFMLIFCESAAETEQTVSMEREDEIIAKAVQTLKAYWETSIYDGITGADGYLEIKYTRVVYLCDPLPVKLPETAKTMFSSMKGCVEFFLLSDYYGAHPYYHHLGLYECVAFYQDGTYAVVPVNPIDRYRSITYSNDYSDIIQSISDRNAEFNQVFHLKVER